jgi:HNH endonuclease/helix-turn-helix resolvase-like protein
MKFLARNCIVCGKEYQSKHKHVLHCGLKCSAQTAASKHRYKITWDENWIPAKVAGLSTPCHDCNSHYLNESGYPKIRRNGELTTVHRYLYEQKHGILPKEIVVRHKCDNSKCINLDHVETGTQRENTNDTKKRGRIVNPPIMRGETNNAAKLTKEKVIQIRELLSSGVSVGNLMKRFSIGKSQLYRIKRGQSWVC